MVPEDHQHAVFFIQLGIGCISVLVEFVGGITITFVVIRYWIAWINAESSISSPHQYPAIFFTQVGTVNSSCSTVTRNDFSVILPYESVTEQFTAVVPIGNIEPDDGVADVFVLEEKLYCEFCQSHDCEHVQFAALQPEAIELLTFDKSQNPS